MLGHHSNWSPTARWSLAGSPRSSSSSTCEWHTSPVYWQPIIVKSILSSCSPLGVAQVVDSPTCHWPVAGRHRSHLARKSRKGGEVFPFRRHVSHQQVRCGHCSLLIPKLGHRHGNVVVSPLSLPTTEPLLLLHVHYEVHVEPSPMRTRKRPRKSRHWGRWHSTMARDEKPQPSRTSRWNHIRILFPLAAWEMIALQ